MEFSCWFQLIKAFFIELERVMAHKSFIMRIIQMLLTRLTISQVSLRDLELVAVIEQFVFGMLTNIKFMQGLLLLPVILYASLLLIKF